MKKIAFLTLLAVCFSSLMAQVRQSELAGKYHLTAKCQLWDNSFANQVFPHEDFVFNLEAQEDGSFLLYSFFYNGMDESFVPLGYSATATFSAQEQLLYVYPTAWMWDEFYQQFMDPYSDNPMLYFAVKRDANGVISLASTPNSLGFYYLTTLNGESKFVYAIDYPEAVTATKLDTYASVTRATLSGDYTMSYVDADNRQQSTTFTIRPDSDGSFTLTGIFGDATPRKVHFEFGEKGIWLPFTHDISGGYYVNYFGSYVGDCRVSFSFDANGRLVLDNFFSYSPDFRNWIDVLAAVAVKSGSSIESQQPLDNNQQPLYDLSGRRTTSFRGLGIIGNRVVLIK